MNNSIKSYEKNDTLGKSQVDLIIKVYDGAINSFRSASENIKSENMSEAREYLEKAKKFLTHLFTTLDMEKGGDIAIQLAELYSFIINQINVIEATKDLKMIDDNINILSNLKEGWIGLKDLNEEEVAQPESQETAETSVSSVNISG